MNVTGGTTDVTTYFVLRTAATGVELTGATVTNMDLQYTRTGTAPVAKVDATALAATDSVHADNKAIQIDATSSPGLYRVDWPDAAFAAGARQVILSVLYATAFTEHMAVDIDTPVDVAKISTDATAADNLELFMDGTGYAGGSTKLGVDAVAISGDTTAADNCELMFDGTGYVGGTTKLGVDIISVSSDTTAADNLELFMDGTGYAGGTTKLNVNVSTVTNDALTAAALNADAAAEIADAVWNETSTGHTTAGYAGAQLWTDVDAILADTGTDGVVLGTGAITAAVVATGAIDADALAADAGTEIAAAVWDKTGETVGAVVQTGQMLRDIYAFCKGKIVYANHVGTYYDDDGTTSLYVLTAATTGRTTS